MTWHLSNLTASLMSDESISNNADHLTLHTVLGSSMHARAKFGTKSRCQVLDCLSRRVATKK